MKHLPLFRILLVAVAIAAGCSAPTSGVLRPAREPAWRDTGTPPTTVALEAETRYYVDEKGAVWDDRGRKREAAP